MPTAAWLIDFERIRDALWEWRNLYIAGDEPSSRLLAETQAALERSADNIREFCKSEQERLIKRKMDLNALKALEAKATPGPWKGVRPDHSAWFVEQDGKPWRETHHVLTATKCPACKDLPNGTCGVPSGEDAVLIVAIRNALPALIAAAEERDEWKAIAEANALAWNDLRSRDRILSRLEAMPQHLHVGEHTLGELLARAALDKEDAQ